jgi:hypothetical protein
MQDNETFKTDVQKDGQVGPAIKCWGIKESRRWKRSTYNVLTKKFLEMLLKLTVFTLYSRVFYRCGQD